MNFRDFIAEAQYLSSTATNMLQTYASPKEINNWMNAHAGTAIIGQMETAVKRKDTNKIKQYLAEAKMTDDEILSACNAIVKNGDDKAKEFAQGMIDYHKEKGSFHPNQVSGLQNMMKNASFQMADK